MVLRDFSCKIVFKNRDISYIKILKYMNGKF